MTVTCKCGGRYMRCDLYRKEDKDSPLGYYVIDSSSRIAVWKCLKCGRIRMQRKRVQRVQRVHTAEASLLDRKEK
jgi:hypothetical protein